MGNLNQKPQKHQNLNQKPLKHQNLNLNPKLNLKLNQKLNLKLNLNQRKLKKSPHQNPNQKPLKHQNLNQNRSPKQQQRNRALRSTKHVLRKRNGCQPTSTPVPQLSSNVLVEDSVSNGGKLKDAVDVSHPSTHTNANTFMRHPPTHLLKTHKHGNVSSSATVVSVYGLQIGGVGLAYDF